MIPARSLEHMKAVGLRRELEEKEEKKWRGLAAKWESWEDGEG